MPDIKLLQEELEQTLDRRTAIREKHKGTLPEDMRAEDEQLHERGLKIKTLIEDEKQKARDADFNDLGKYMTDPNYRVPRAVNDDLDSKKMLAGAAWEIKDGNIYRETSTGAKVMMYGEDVLFGPVPTNPRDAEVANYCKQTRSIFQPLYRDAYVKWLRSVRMETSQVWNQLSGEEQKALSEGVDGAGGYLVPPDIQAELLARTAQRSVFRRLGRVINTSRDRVVYPRVEAAAATEGGLASGGGSVFSSGFVGTWAGETPAFSDKDPVFGTFDIPIRKIRVATKLANDFVADSIVNIAQWLAQNGADNMALVEDQGFVTGDGTALQPLGILNDSGLVTVDVEGSTTDTISNASGAGSSDKLIKNQVYGLPAQYADNAQWLFRRSIEGKIRALADSTGRYLWPLQAGSAFGPPNGVGFRTLMEYPVNNSDFVPADGTNGSKVTLFGDFSAYIIAQRAQISTTVLRERFADTDQVGIIIFERIGGALWNPDAIRCGIV